MTGPDRKQAARSIATDIAVLVGFVALCLLVGYFGSVATTPNLDPWYAGLAKPAFTPPPIVFPVVWTILYVTMAVAAWLVWRSDSGDRRWTALFLFAIQLILNGAWSWAFFGAQSPLAGLLVVLPLVVAVAGTTWAFLGVSRPAGLLMMPYLAWASFATVLNAAIFAMN